MQTIKGEPLNHMKSEKIFSTHMFTLVVSKMLACFKIRVFQPHHFDASPAPAPGQNFDEAPATASQQILKE
jgi:hypothetical protein